MEIKEIINKAKREIVKHINAMSFDKTLTNLARSFVCVLCKEFDCTTWSSIEHFIESNTTFKFSCNKTVAENINDFTKGYDTQLEVE